MSSPPHPETPTLAEIVRAGLLQHGYTVAGVRQRLPWLNFFEEFGRSARRFYLPSPADARDELIALFLAGAAVPAERLERRLGADWIDAALKLQLLSREGDRIAPQRAVVPGDGDWTSCRLPPAIDAAPPAAAHGFPAWPPTACDLWMLHGLGREPVERAIALGDDAPLFAGALAASAREVDVLSGSSDVVQAATADFEFRGLSNVRALLPSASVGAAARIVGRFSLSAAVARGLAFVLSAGMERLAPRLCELEGLLAAQVGPRMEEGGEALLSVELPVSAEGSSAALERCVAAAGLRGVFFRAKREEVGAWTAERLRWLQHVAPAEYEQRLSTALDGWRAAGAASIETGVLSLTKDQTKGFRVDHVDDPRHLPWAEPRRRVLAMQARIESEWRLDAPEGRKALLEKYFRTLPSVAADQTVLFHEARWHVTGASVAFLEGLGYTGTIDFLLLQTLPLLNGKRPLGDVVDKLFRVLSVPREQAEPTLLRNLVQLIARGMVEPVEPEKAAVGLPGKFTSTAE